MRPQEEAVVREVLRTLQPMRCLEWGAGFSTLQFPALLPDGAKWLSIEHSPEWADIVRQNNTNPSVTIALVEPDASTWPGDGDATSFKNYLAYPAQHGPFDFILVDGRARHAAVTAAARLLAPGGVVVLHDANRAAYASALTTYDHQILLRDARARARRPAGGIWIGSQTRPIDDVLDIRMHERLWRFYRGAGRLLA